MVVGGGGLLAVGALLAPDDDKPVDETPPVDDGGRVGATVVVDGLGRPLICDDEVGVGAEVVVDVHEAVSAASITIAVAILRMGSLCRLRRWM